MPSQRHLVLERPDGTVIVRAVVALDVARRYDRKGEVTDPHLAVEAAKMRLKYRDLVDPDEVMTYEELAAALDPFEPTELPPDRRFRDAWVASAEAVVVDMAKAREIHMARIRTTRDAELQALDGEHLRAIGADDAAAAADVEARKQALRDLPRTFALEPYQTPDELAAAWPAELPVPEG